MAGDDVAEVVRATGIAALAHHGVEAAGGERWELLERGKNERQIGIDARGSEVAKARQAGPRQYSGDGSIVHVKLPSDGVREPALHVIVAQDLRFQLRGDSHGSRPLPRRRKLVRTNGEQGRPHQWQRHGGCSGDERDVRDVLAAGPLGALTVGAAHSGMSSSGSC